MKSLYWKIRIIIFAAQRIWGVHLGDSIWYQGKLWTVTQGVSCPVWTLRREGESVEAHQDLFRKQKTVSNGNNIFDSVKLGDVFSFSCGTDCTSSFKISAQTLLGILSNGELA